MKLVVLSLVWLSLTSALFQPTTARMLTEDGDGDGDEDDGAGDEDKTPDSICVKYTKALFGEDTAGKELALVRAVVNLAVLGDAELGVAGILAAEGGLAPFFDGTAATTNRGGDAGIQVNFLDGAGDLPNPDPSSNTSILLVHLYQFFGALLGCSATGFPVCK